ncbi:PREDICTED: CKLF-like MARVEL transmembrane domain-containing protein 6 [Cyprinodon variegatus]|uniref:CKLF-like MARVEL transmembrane domain containing 6 n=1 Tax=Cyprinodon variegatus TaxID=28743 RepID=A0A3Q2CSZ7_CYPVA|nr:PREDICTED: CKLF-like MARVEL transmembrane domain-containing protein 6 [Cyprinodon variegatus]
MSVYSPTTVSTPKDSCCLGTEFLGKPRFFLKIAEVLFSLVAFVLEETVTSCSSCSPLYFFEFVSCTAFLFTALLLVLLSTTLHKRVGINCWPKVDFLYTLIIAVLFLISSIVFASDNGGTSVEKASVAFGFVAMVLFCIDVGLFVKTSGNPFRNSEGSPTANGGPAQPEVEKLNGDVPAESNGAQ